MLLVFDLDGTLVDSSRDLADSANALLVSYGAVPLDAPSVMRMVGEGAAVLVARLMAARGVQADPAEALARFLAIYDERLLAHTRPYDGIPEALSPGGEMFGEERLRDVLASSSPLTAEATAETLIARVAAWTGRTAGFDDDLTLVVAGLGEP